MDMRPKIDENSLLIQFRELVESSNKTSGYQLPDALLLQYLRARSYNLKECHRILANYLTLITQRSDLFSWRDSIRTVASLGIYYQYLVKNVDGSKIIVIRPGYWDPLQTKFADFLSLAFFMCEMSLAIEEFQHSGFRVILDMRNFGFSHIYQIGVTGIHLAAYYTDHCSALKINCTHVIYENRFTNVAYNIFKPFLSEAFKEKIRFHGDDLETLYQVIPKSHLPPSLGGTNVEFSGDYYVDWLDKHKDSVVQHWESTRKRKQLD